MHHCRIDNTKEDNAYEAKSKDKLDLIKGKKNFCSSILDHNYVQDNERFLIISFKKNLFICGLSMKLIR